MQDDVVLDFVQKELDAGKCNKDIVQALREHHQIDISHRTLTVDKEAPIPTYESNSGSR